MPERTGYDNGVPSWVDLATTDVEGAKTFYGALFGWDAMDVPTDQGGSYTMFSKNGKAVAGMGELPAEQQAAGVPPLWATYIAVDDVDATIAKVEASGGSVVMPAMDVMDQGRMAFVNDSTGAAVGLWQAGQHYGAQLVNEAGALSWNELITDDTASAQKFYTDVFGYGVEVAEMPNGPYTSFKLGDKYIGGMMGKTEDMGDFPNYWGVYFGTDDCDASLEIAKANGGRVIMEAMDIPEVGRFGVVADPAGAAFTVIKLIDPAP